MKVFDSWLGDSGKADRNSHVSVCQGYLILSDQNDGLLRVLREEIWPYDNLLRSRLAGCRFDLEIRTVFFAKMENHSLYLMLVIS